MSTPNESENKKLPSPEDIAVGKKIKELREERSLNQHEFAQMLGLNSTKTYQNYELGYRSVSKEMIQALMERLGVNPMWLLSDAEDKYLKESKTDPYTMAKTFESLTEGQRQELMLRAKEMLELNEMKEAISFIHDRFNRK